MRRDSAAARCGRGEEEDAQVFWLLHVLTHSTTYALKLRERPQRPLSIPCWEGEFGPPQGGKGSTQRWDEQPQLRAGGTGRKPLNSDSSGTEKPPLDHVVCLHKALRHVCKVHTALRQEGVLLKSGRRLRPRLVGIRTETEKDPRNGAKRRLRQSWDWTQ